MLFKEYLLLLIALIPVIMSFTLLNPSRLKNGILMKQLTQEPLSWRFRPNFARHFSLNKEEVILKDGRKGWIHERKAGWFTIALNSEDSTKVSV